MCFQRRADYPFVMLATQPTVPLHRRLSLNDAHTALGTRAANPWWRHLLQMIIVATLTALSLAPAGAASAASDGGGSPEEPKPTIVLVHGAWADGSSLNA